MASQTELDKCYEVAMDLARRAGKVMSLNKIIMRGCDEKSEGCVIKLLVTVNTGHDMHTCHTDAYVYTCSCGTHA